MKLLNGKLTSERPIRGQKDDARMMFSNTNAPLYGGVRVIKVKVSAVRVESKMAYSFFPAHRLGVAEQHFAQR